MDYSSLVCPKDRTKLTLRLTTLCCDNGHTYPVVDGVPVLLRDDIEQTMTLAKASIARANNVPGAVDTRNPDLYLESLGVSESEKLLAINLAASGSNMDPVVSVVVGATNGIAYKHLVGGEFDYPIPEMRLPAGAGRTLLDIGCNWGRWSIAAARKGYRVVGIDPSLSAIMTARRVARKLGLPVDYICADARYLPFRNGSFNVAFSYSVIQHFSRDHAAQTFDEIARILRAHGTCLVQMPNRLGLRNLAHLAKRGFTEGAAFDVRYWTLSELRKTFERRIGPTNISVHCYFGLGLESTDRRLMSTSIRFATDLSEGLRRASTKFRWLVNLADSVYVSAEKVPLSRA